MRRFFKGKRNRCRRYLPTKWLCKADQGSPEDFWLSQTLRKRFELVWIYRPRCRQRPPSISEPSTRTCYPLGLLWTVPRSSSVSPGVRGQWCGRQEGFRCPAGISAAHLEASAVEPAAIALYPRSHRLLCIQVGPEPDDSCKLGHNIPAEHPFASNPRHGSKGVQIQPGCIKHSDWKPGPFHFLNEWNSRVTRLKFLLSHHTRLPISFVSYTRL